MIAMSYAERARRFRSTRGTTADRDCEVSEISETSPSPSPVVESQQVPRSCAESAITPERAYLPLDQGIVEDVASKHPHDEIEARLARLAARAALPSATALDRAVADDWRHILGAKENAS